MHLDVQAGELQVLAAGEDVLGLVALERPEPGRHPAHDVGQHRPLDRRAVDRRAGGPRERRDRADVVEVAVGDEDRLDLDAERLDGLEQALGLVARVDQQRAARLSRRRARCRSSPGRARR